MATPDPPAHIATPPDATPRGQKESAQDPLAAFPTEAQVAAAAAARRLWRERMLRVGFGLLGAAVAVVVLVATWASVSAFVRRVLRPAELPATLTVQSTPAGWDVIEGDRKLGTTPLTVSLPAGRHALRLRRGTATRDLDVTLAAGATVVHHLDLLVAPASGGLRVETAPPGARVSVDGVARGVSPLTIPDLTPGEHAVAIADGRRAVNHRVTVVAGTTASLVVPLAAAGGAADAVGWATILSPIELQVFEGEALIGNSLNQRIMLMPGRHLLRLVNAAVGYETTTAVQIAAGAVARVVASLPNGSLSINAVPWAEVLLDGKVIGETPIANFTVPIGPHDVVLRNPKFPEQRRTVLVTLGAPVRLGVDLRQ